jgi:hypothetical protein
MLKLILLFVFFFIIIISNAQQTVILENISNGKVMTVKLPALVSIKFKNASYKELLLDKVSNDSFFFKNYNNQPENNDCSINAISNMKFPKKGDKTTQNEFNFFTISAFIITPLTIAGILYKPTELDETIFMLSTLFGIPYSITSILTSAALSRKLPVNFSPKKWRIYVK